MRCASVNGPLQRRRRDQGGEEDHNDDHRIQGEVQNSHNPADAGKNQADLAPGNHAETHDQTVDALGQGKGRGHLTENGYGGKNQARHQHPWVGQGGDVNLQAHQDEKHRGEDPFQRRHNGLERMVAKMAVLMNDKTLLIQDQPGRKRADDGGQPHDIGQPGQDQQQTKGVEEFDITLIQSGKEGDLTFQQIGPKDNHRPQKQGCFQNNETHGTDFESPTGDDAGDHGQDDQPQDIVQYGCA